MDYFRWTWSPSDPLWTPLAPSAPIKALLVPKRPSSNGLYTSTSALQLREKGGEPVGTLVEQYN